jgi:hypothetical protein
MTDLITRWHEIARTLDPALIPALLAEDVVFRSPAVHPPQVGRERASAYLGAAVAVLGPGLTYEREWRRPTGAVLEFTTRLDDIDVHGVDIIEWDDSCLITDFTVMVRPVKGLQIVIEKMAAELMRGRS